MMGKARRVVTYLSGEQYEAFKAEMERRGIDEATLLRHALYSYMRSNMVFVERDWPHNDPERGGQREGAGYPKGRPRKNGGRKKKIAI